MSTNASSVFNGGPFPLCPQDFFSCFYKGYRFLGRHLGEQLLRLHSLPTVWYFRYQLNVWERFWTEIQFLLSNDSGCKTTDELELMLLVAFHCINNASLIKCGGFGTRAAAWKRHTCKNIIVINKNCTAFWVQRLH